MKLITQFMAFGLEFVLLLGTTAFCRALKLPLWCTIVPNYDVPFRHSDY